MTGAITNPFGWPQWLWRVAIVPVAVFVVAGIFNNLAGMALSAGLIPFGDPGFIASSLAERPGWYEVDQVTPAGPAEQAGVRPGDRVRYDQPLHEQFLPRPGETVPLTIERDGRQLSATVAARPGSGGGLPGLFAFQHLSQLLSLGFGLVLLVRGRNNRAAVLLGVLLVLVGGLLLNLFWVPNPLVAYVLPFIWWAGDVAFSYFWLIFALEVSGGSASRGQSRFVHGLGVAFALAYGLADPPGPAGDPVFIPLLVLLDQLTGYAIIAWNYRRNDAPARNRLKIVLLAFICYLLATLFFIAGAATQGLAIWAVGISFGYIAPALLTYSVLRQRLFDFGFAVNRTLIFGAVAFTLLATFGLVEYGAKSLIPKAWPSAGPFISAGIAVVLFLSFHRLHEWFEHHIERLFFHKWHHNDATLRRFVGSAGHFEDGPVLCRAFAEQLTRFAGGADATVYLRAGPGAYRLAAGELADAPADHGEDDPLFALMRAERRPIDLAHAHAGLPGALALPMLDHGTLAGFVLLDAKPDRHAYRPDEIELLGWAAHQVGLDLQALRARELEGEVASLREKVALLSELARSPRTAKR